MEKLTFSLSSPTVNTCAEPQRDDTAVDLPLHQAIEEFSMGSLLHHDNEKRLEAIEDLVDEFPESVLLYDNKGRLPLHLACQEGAPLDVIKCLLHAWPDTLESPTNDKRRMLPVHMACRYYNSSNKEKSETLLYLLQLRPWTAKAETTTGQTAIHLLLQNYFCTLSDLQFVVDLYPEALALKTHDRQKTPLHIACEQHYMERSTKRTRPRDDDPSSSNFEIVRFMLRVSPPETLRTANARGELPLHTALRSHQCYITVSRILAACPEAIHYVNRRGQTALHLATTCRVPCNKTVKLLLQLDPKAAHQPDQQGNLPQMRGNGHD